MLAHIFLELVFKSVSTLWAAHPYSAELLLPMVWAPSQSSGRYLICRENPWGLRDNWVTGLAWEVEESSTNQMKGNKWLVSEKLHC